VKKEKAAIILFQLYLVGGYHSRIRSHLQFPWSGLPLNSVLIVCTVGYCLPTLDRLCYGFPITVNGGRLFHATKSGGFVQRGRKIHLRSSCWIPLGNTTSLVHQWVLTFKHFFVFKALTLGTICPAKLQNTSIHCFQ